MCSLNQVAVVGVLHVYLSLSRMEVTARVKNYTKVNSVLKADTFPIPSMRRNSTFSKNSGKFR